MLSFVPTRRFGLTGGKSFRETDADNNFRTIIFATVQILRDIWCIQ